MRLSKETNQQTKSFENLTKTNKKKGVNMTKGILKCFSNGNQYNLVKENDSFKIYYDFGRVMFEICTDDEQKAVEQFKNFFGKSATYDKFYLGFND